MREIGSADVLEFAGFRFDRRGRCLYRLEEAGDLVLLPAALYNLDERKFTDPMTVDFHRPIKHHMAFGTGIHRCLGAQLARLELRVLLQEWLPRIPDFWIDDPAAVVVKSGRINGVRSLPLRWKH